MDVLALPGRRIETEAWMKSLLVAAGLGESNVVRYRHWATNAEASVTFEAGCLANQSPDLVVAKSLGTVIAATAFRLHGFRPASAVLIGTPYGAVEGEEVEFFRQFAAGVETLFIQQIGDPGGSAAKLPAALNVAASRVVAVPGDDDLYSDTESLGSIIRRWQRQRPVPSGAPG